MDSAGGSLSRSFFAFFHTQAHTQRCTYDEYLAFEMQLRMHVGSTALKPIRTKSCLHTSKSPPPLLSKSTLASCSTCTTLFRSELIADGICSSSARRICAVLYRIHLF